MDTSRWIVAQIGAREHYAVPRALHQQGHLRALYTDAWAPVDASLLRNGPGLLRSLAGRHHPDLPDHLVTSFTTQALYQRIKAQFTVHGTRTSAYFDHHRQVGASFAARVWNDMKRSAADLDQTVFFGYNTGSLEVLEGLKPTGALTLLDQIDPGRVERDIVQEECDRWPGWARSRPAFNEAFEQRLRAEWDCADRIIVNSEWSADALTEQNVPRSKIHVVPLAYDPPTHPTAADLQQVERPPVSHAHPLRVLWLGSVILRKGIPYLIEAARRLRDAPISFSVVGPIGISEDALASAPENVSFEGRIQRSDVGTWYRDADVFVLPTLSDGFAITQLEAMAHGLPVVATPRCGRVVEDGANGHIVPARDAESLADTLRDLMEHPDRLAAMSVHARKTAETYTLDRVGDALHRIATTSTSHA